MTSRSQAKARKGAKPPAKKASAPKADAKSANAKSSAAPILSMTGFGKSSIKTPRLSGSVETRSFNHRHLKIALKVPSYFSSYETKIEQLIRDRVARGSVSMTVKAVLESRRNPFDFDDQAIAGYVEALRRVKKKFALEGEPSLDMIPSLPDTLISRDIGDSVTDADWRAVRAEVMQAVDRLCAMRAAEGRKLERDIVKRRRNIAKFAKQIAKIAPTVVDHYRQRLHTRINNLLSGTEAEVDETALAREVAIFADRCDISEEIARIDSHLLQFDDIVASGHEAGRRLEFILHELFREANTIGSKSNDSTISHLVVEIKAEIEKIREQVQNIE